MSKVKKKKENFLRRKELFFEEFVWHFMLGMWILGIFILSGIEGSGQHYYNLQILIERKAAHIFEFFILAYLFWKVLYFYSLGHWEKIGLTFLLSSFFASWDEVHQLFVFGREGKILDVGIDVMGILLFAGFVLFQRRFFAEKKILR